MKEIYVLEKCRPKKEPEAVFATFDEVFAIEEMRKANDAREPGVYCHFRVTPVPFKESE